MYKMTYATVEIMGGLGNQLFQIFTLIAYCFQHKTAFYFSDKPIQHGQRKKVYWSTLLKTLEPFTRGVSTPRTPPGGKPPTPPIGGKVEEQTNEAPNEILNPHRGAWGVQSPNEKLNPHGGVRGVLTPRVIAEQNFHYQALPSPPENQDVALFGYFQSYKYFEDHQCDIFRIIKLRDSQATVRAKYPYNYAKTLAVHFRVGDYVNLPNHHPIMTLEYYTQALKQFLKDMPEHKLLSSSGRESALCETLHQAQQAQQAQQAHACTWNILYFCEQNDQVFVDTHFIKPLQQHPELMGKFTFQCIDHTLEDWTQMLVMSLCKHHIIANSTFSWWGAFLANDSTNANDSANANDSTNESSSSSKVYYPSTWFGPAMTNKNLADLFPSDWRKIN